MEQARRISILYPAGQQSQGKVMSDVACHDLGLDVLCEEITKKINERTVILSILKTMYANPAVADYRSGVFRDICDFPQMRERMLKLLDRIQFLNDYGSFKREHDIKSGLWEFLHRLSELSDYIETVEAIRDCLSETPIQSRGLKDLKQYVEEIYEESLFRQLKEDVANLKADTDSLKSITIGVNLNRNFEVDSIGLISVNNKEFKSSGVLGNFADAMRDKGGIRDGNEWSENYRFHPIQNRSGDLLEKAEHLGKYMAVSGIGGSANLTTTVAGIPEKDPSAYVTHYFDKEVSQLLSHLVKKLERILSRYVSYSIHDIVDLIPEFLYYVRFAEYMETLKQKGYTFCTPQVLGSNPEGKDGLRMCAKGLYNLKLALTGVVAPEDIVVNDLSFDDAHTVYILTGANRGGKTTVTQAVGILYVLAQGGICVPAEHFSYLPVDCIYTHYPADEDKTLDLGRLGEECSRFKEIYEACTKDSLLLLNETFSTTSFEEGYYIAEDSIKALMHRQVRTIYNTHMHKLAYSVAEYNRGKTRGLASSLVAHTSEGKRSFKVTVDVPEGKSYAEDIARKYGVTYEQLIGQ